MAENAIKSTRKAKKQNKTVSAVEFLLLKLFIKFMK